MELIWEEKGYQKEVLLNGKTKCNGPEDILCTEDIKKETT